MNQSNTTTGFSNYLQNLITTGEGSIISATNGLLLLTILLDKSIRKRKEMLLIAGLAGTDLFFGVGLLLTGIYSLWVIWLGEQYDRISMFDCILTRPFINMANIGGQLTEVMNLAVSIDRLTAIAWPIKYRLLGGRYAMKVLALVALFGVVSTTAMFLTTYFYTDPGPTVGLTCSHDLFSFSYEMFHIASIAGSGYASFVVYICVFIAYRRAMRKTASTTTAHGHEQKAINTQRRLTVTVGIINLSTLCATLCFSLLSYNALTGGVSSFLLVPIVRLSTVNNVLIYVYRQKEMRTAMWKLIKCKKVPTMSMTDSTAHIVGTAETAH